MFIAFEGIEGAGKTTQLRRVAEALRARGVQTMVTREPGGTRVGEAIRGILLDDALPMSAAAETFLILAARTAFVREVVRPALAEGQVVLTDRYDLSTFAYQGGGRGVSMGKLREMNEFATGGLRPHLYIVLDVEVGEGLRRLAGATRDRIEGEEIDFHERVARAYRELADEDPSVVLVESRGDKESTFRAIWEVLSGRFPETFPSEKG